MQLNKIELELDLSNSEKISSEVHGLRTSRCSDIQTACPEVNDALHRERAEIYLNKMYLKDKELVFLSFALNPIKYVIKNKINKLTSWGLIKGIDQYKFIKNRFRYLTKESCDDYMMFFEQTKDGNIHAHAVIKSNNEHDLKCEIAELFRISKIREAQISIHLRPFDLKGFDYIFRKVEKKYENVDWEKFNPIYRNI